MHQRIVRATIAWLAPCVLLASGAAGAADAAKVLRIALPRAETGFDPAMASEIYSSAVIAAIMEPLLTFDYLARPVKVVALTAEALPEITDDGRTYTFRIKPGILFAADPAFKGKPRELAADDYIYAIKRLVDPALRSPNAFYVAGKIVGLDEAAAAAAKPNATFDYGAKIAGLEAVDRHTLRIRLKRSDYTFPSVIALPALSAVAREVVEAYPGNVQAHPVGTGPFALKSWVPASKITLEANPAFRDVVWDFAPGNDPGDKAIAAAMRGKKMPQLARIEINVMEEPQSRWLAFQKGELDILELPGTFSPMALRGDKLAPDLTAKGIYLSRLLDPSITYTAFNMRDPVVGGFDKEKIALRRAIVMAYDVAEEIGVIRKGQAAPLETPIPPGVAGYPPSYRSGIRHDPAAANRLLDQMGFRRGSDGYRTLPDGKPLVLNLLEPDRCDCARLRRPVEEGARFDRHPARDRQRQIQRPDQSRHRLPVPDVELRVDRRLSRRRQLHAAAVRTQHEPEQRRLLLVAKVRRALRRVATDGRLAGANPAFRADGPSNSKRTRRGGCGSRPIEACWCSRA